MKYKLFIIATSFFFFQCKKDIEIVCDTPLKICESPISEMTPVDTCFDLPLDALGNVVTNYSGKYFFSPRFSKTQEDEFIFLHAEINDEFRVYKTNLCNEYYEAGFDISLLDNPQLFDINENDELLIREGGRLWRVDFDGNNLFKLLDDNYLYNGGYWCLNDSLIYSYIDINDTSSPYYPGRSVLLDRMGNIVHAFPQGVGSPFARIKENKILTLKYAVDFSSYDIGYIDVMTKMYHSILEFEIPSSNGDNLVATGWLDDEHILCVGNTGNNHKLYKLNILTKEPVLIYENDCENFRLGEQSISSFNSEEILIARTEHRYVADHPDSLYYFQNIVKYNIVTGEQWILNIDL